MQQNDDVVAGWLSGSDSIDGLENPAGPLYIEGREKPLRIKSARHANATLIVQFDGIDDRTTAETVKGARLYVARTQLPPLQPGVYYQADLIGLEVIAGEERLGRVSRVVNFGGGDLLEIERDGTSLLVPFTGAEVDLAQGLVKVELPEGFLEDQG